MQLTDDKMRADIRAAVQDLEKSTEGEMVCVIAASSAFYILFPMLWAAFAALMLPLLNPLLQMTGGAAVVTFSVQGIVFTALALILSLPYFRAGVTPRRLRDNICHRAAFEQFYKREMHKTKNATGVLLYVSVAEHYVGFLADTGIRARIKDSEWDAVINPAVAELRKGRIRDGYLAAIKGAKTLLAAHFPEKKPPVNQLDDGLVELPASALVH